MEQHTLPSGEFSQHDPARTQTMERFELRFERALSGFLGPIDGSPVAEQLKWHFAIGCDPIVARGKRVRARLVFGVAFDEGGTFEAAIDAALAIELLHNYSLVHDDIEDCDLQRRGRETVWARFGVAQGINAGDAAGALAYLTLLENSGAAPPERVVAAGRVLHAANFAMCVGQGYDLEFESAREVSLQAYLAMIDGKTAALFGAACELGAICAGADAPRAHGYREIGRAFGRAFQIRDDVKGLHCDIVRRKWSFPLVWALAGPPSDARSAIASAYAKASPLDCSDVALVESALEVLGARAAAQAASERQIARATRLAERGRLDRAGTIRDLFLSCAAARP